MTFSRLQILHKGELISHCQTSSTHETYSMSPITQESSSSGLDLCVLWFSDPVSLLNTKALLRKR